MPIEKISFAEKLKIGDLAKELGVTPRTLRYYEEEGLVKGLRSSKGTRHYNDEHVERFKAILLLAHLGIPLQEIKRLGCARPESKTGNESSRKVSTQLDEFLMEVEDKIHELSNLKEQVRNAQAVVQECFGCRRKPIRDECDKCPIGENLNKSRLLYLIWDQRES